jgi:hypothetical protein
MEKRGEGDENERREGKWQRERKGAYKGKEKTGGNLNI